MVNAVANMMKDFPHATMIFPVFQSEKLELCYEGAQIRGQHGVFDANELVIRNAFNSYEAEGSSFSMRVEAGTNGASVSGSYEKHKGSAKQAVNASIQFTNNLTVHVEGTADISGTVIEADSVKFSAAQLLLASIHDLAENDGWGVSASVSNQARSYLSGLGGNIENGSKEWISELTSIMGRESLELVIAHSLTLTGAMVGIAAKADPTMEDPATKLVVKAAELYVKDLHGYDNGITLGLSWANAMPTFPGTDVANPLGAKYGAEFGAHASEQIARATITKGTIIIGGKELTEDDLEVRGINQDPTQALTSETTFDVKKQSLSYTTIANETAWEEQKAMVTEFLNDPIKTTVKGVQESVKHLGEQVTKFATTIQEVWDGLWKVEEKATEVQHQQAAALAAAHPGLSEDAALYIVKHTPSEDAPSETQDVNVIRADAMVTNSVAILHEYYGDRIPEEAQDQLLQGKIVRVEGDTLVWTDRAEVSNNHRLLLQAADTAKEMIHLAKDVEERYGTAMQVTIIAATSLLMGPARAAMAVVKGAVGEAALSPVKEKLIDATIQKLQSFDPYLSTDNAHSIAAAGVEMGMVAVGAAYDMKAGSGASTKLEHHATDKKLLPVHSDTIDTMHHPLDADLSGVIDFNSYSRIDIGRLSADGAKKMLDSLPDRVAAGRIDYRDNFVGSLENFVAGTERLFHGKLEKDLFLINYHDGNLPLGANNGERTVKWATHIEVGNRMPTMDDVHQHLALVKPDWGDRNSVSIIKIPKGTAVTFVSGKAAEKLSINGEVFKGGGYQVRFRDFDPQWILETRRIDK